MCIYSQLVQSVLILKLSSFAQSETPLQKLMGPIVKSVGAQPPKNFPAPENVPTLRNCFRRHCPWFNLYTANNAGIGNFSHFLQAAGRSHAACIPAVACLQRVRWTSTTASQSAAVSIYLTCALTAAHCTSRPSCSRARTSARVQVSHDICYRACEGPHPITCSLENSLRKLRD